MARHGSNVLVIDGNRRHLALLEGVTRMIVERVDAAERLAEIDDLSRYTLVMADYQALSPEEQRRLFSYFQESGGRSHLLLLSSRPDYSRIFAAFDEYGIANLLAKNEGVDAVELIITLQKILRGDIFGLEKYFGWGVEEITRRVHGSSEREAVVAEAEDYAGALAIHPRLLQRFCTVVDELLTNALYDAPVDSEGRHRFADLPRTEPVELDPGEEVVVTCCSDGRTLGVSVSDPFGALSRRCSLEYLARCFSSGDAQVADKPGGAGLGIFFAFDGMSQLVFNIRPRVRTEAIGLIDIRGSYRDFASRSKSFNVFVESAGG
jgi:hypothetical protein